MNKDGIKGVITEERGTGMRWGNWQRAFVSRLPSRIGWKRSEEKLQESSVEGGGRGWLQLMSR